MRAVIRAATDTQALAAFTATTREWMAKIRSEGLTKALDERGAKFGDCRTASDVQRPRASRADLPRVKLRELGSRRDIALTVDC